MQVLANAIRTGLLAAIISLGVSSAAVAGPFEDALDAAEQGHAGAQHDLGSCPLKVKALL